MFLRVADLHRFYCICYHFSLGTDAYEFTVGVGIQDRNHVYSSNVVHVRHVYVHEHYDKHAQKNDIALMKLSKAIDITGRYM